MNNTNNLYAIVTGAAGGLGKAFAVEMSRRGFNTLLIDLPQTGLPQICSGLSQQFGTQSYFFEIDLTEKENIIGLTEAINQKYPVAVLINNAGVGGTKRFEQVSAEYLDTIIQLNMKAPVLLTKLLLQNLKNHEQSYILNVSSMAAFSPIAYKTVYPASKTFVRMFSRGLYQEYRNSNIFVSVVHPGPMKTNPEITSRIEKQGVFGKAGLLTPDRVAQISINQLFRKNPSIILNFPNRINLWLMKIVPLGIRLPVLSRIIERELK